MSAEASFPERVSRLPRPALRDWRLLFGLLVLLYVGLRLAAYLPSSARAFPDSGTYLHVAGQPLISGEFLAGWRGWTVPLLYKLLPDSDSVRTAAQLTISIVCWLSLAAVTAWCVQRRALRLVAFCLVLLFSLSVWITQWDSLVLSESLAVSLTAAVLAAWLAFVRLPGPWTVAGVLVTTLLWSFARDSDAYVAVLVLPFVLAWIAFRGVARDRLVLALGLAAVFGVFLLSLDRPSAQPRWERALHSVIGVRVLEDEGELRYFRDRGMPVTPRLRALAGEPLGLSDYKPLVDGPRLAAYREWVLDRGRRTLATYLLIHPDRALAPAVSHPDTLFAIAAPADPLGEPLAYYRAQGTDPLLPAPLGSVVYPSTFAALVAWLGVVIAAACALAWLGATRSIWLVPAIALFLQIPHAALVWHGDPNEIPRHALLVGVLTRLSLLLLSIFLIDALLGLRDRGAAQSRRPATGG